MHVPAAFGDFDVANAFFYQTACQQAALAKFAFAILFLQGRRFVIEMEGFQVRAGHDADRFVIELRVALHLGGLKAITESGVELFQHDEAFDHLLWAGFVLGVLQARVGIEDGQRGKARREEAIAVLGLAVDADAGGQRLVAGAKEMLRPGTNVGVLDGAALLIAGADNVLTGGMHSCLGTHAADDADLVRLLGQVHHRAAQLKVALGFDRGFWPLGRATLGVQRVDVGHAADHLEEDDVLGLAEAGA